MTLNYTANAYAPFLAVTVPNLSIVGNNIESSIVTVNIANNGNAPATISAESLINAPAYITRSGSCLGSLAVGASCNLSLVKLGPFATNTLLTPTNVLYSVNYSGGTILTPTPESANAVINATVQPNSQSLTIEAQPLISQAGRTVSGDGSAGNPYVYDGSDPQYETITINYKNTGTNPIVITGVNNTNSPYNWIIDTTASDCYNSGSLPSASIAVNSSCNIVFKNVLFDNFIGLGSALGASYTMNLSLPEIIFKDPVIGSQFSITPQVPAPILDSVVYAVSHQATLSSSITQDVGTGANVTITNTLANANGYSPITVTTQTEDYFSNSINPILSNCAQNNTTTSGVRTQICTLSPSNSVGSGIYSLDSSAYQGETLHAIFSISTSHQVVAVGQMYGQLLLH